MEQNVSESNYQLSTSNTREPKCHSCDGELPTVSLHVDDRFYHGGCFRCRQCSKSLFDIFFGTSDEPFCPECFRKRTTHTCQACKNPIEDDQAFSLMTKLYHRQCVKCDGCAVPFDQGKCYPASGQVYCLRCYWTRRSGETQGQQEQK